MPTPFRLLPMLFLVWASLAEGTSEHSNLQKWPIEEFREEQSSDLSERIADYRERTQQFLEQALRKGIVSYRDAARASYGPRAVSASILKWKAEWRENVRPLGFRFDCDYETWGDSASLNGEIDFLEIEGESDLIAEYEARGHRIRISGAASGSTLLHEAGHTLQRRAICDEAISACDFSKGARTLPKRSSIDVILLEHLNYLLSQDELEVRFQDLNRVYAIANHGSPIMVAEDSLKALCLLGMPLAPEEVVEAFSRAGAHISQSEAEEMLSFAVVLRVEERVVFGDASELLTLRRLVMRLDPDLWPDLLAKIMYEAPGHL